MTRTSTLNGPAVAQAIEFPLLQHAQKFGLQHERHLADLVQQQGPPVGQLELAGIARQRPGEGAAHVAEQLGLQQVLGDRGAVDGHEGLAPRASFPRE